jgi:hypothetical protein
MPQNYVPFVTAMPFFPELVMVGVRPSMPLVRLALPETHTLPREGLDTFSPGEVDFMMVKFIH